jgi:hypothetical protein
MALARMHRGDSGMNYWPGFVDALSTLILSIIFLLSVFVVRLFYFSPRLPCRFDLALSANSTSWRIASEREGLSGCCFAQVSIADLSAGERRIADTGSCPVAGRPRFFRTTGIDFLAIIVLRKSEPVRSANFSPALTQATEVPHGPG